MRQYSVFFLKGICPILAVILLMILLFFCLYRGQQPRFSPAALSESTAVLQNPYQGFYRIFRYELSDEAFVSEDSVKTYPYPMALLEINLRLYRQGAISAAGLSQLESILERWARSDVQIILRFVYDWDGIAKATEPESLSIILDHMDQVSQVINRYEASVYLMQGAFIGNWGEMHGSYFADDSSIRTLMTHLHQVIAPSVYLSVRTPAQWRMVTGRNDIPAKFPAFQEQPPLEGRLGLFNDGMLGSATDLGTYGDTSRRTASSPSRKGTREEELAFQYRLCQYVPNGGEVVGSAPYSALPAAVQAMKTMHVSYLNVDYDRTVLEQWQRAQWEGADIFRGCDGLTYVQAHLGYRYTARSVSLQKQGFLQPRLTLQLELENTGFGNTLRPFGASFLFRNARTGEVRAFPIRFDLRTLKSGETRTLTAEIPCTELPRESCEILLSITDAAAGKQIALANTAYEAGIGVLLGRLEW